MMLKRWGTPLGSDLLRLGEVDACIIGSGGGGAPVALTLAQAGYRVVILEKGPAYDQRDFINDEIGVGRRNFFRPYTTDEPHMNVDANGKVVRSIIGWGANCIGGSTVHMSGFTYRLHPEDFKLRSILGEITGSALIDWPITFEEMLPYYEKAEIELGVSGNPSKNPFETYRRPLPLPPLPENDMAKIVDEACAKLGYHSYPTARAIISRPYQGRPPCQPNSICGSFGCPVGAKSSTLAALIPKALATGSCQILPLAMAHKIETDSQGRASTVRYLDSKGNENSIKAKVIVVSCSPVETARLLLNSKTKTHPNGLANENGWVGQTLMFIGFGRARAEFPLSDPRLSKIDWSRPWIHRSVQDFYLMGRGTSSPRKGGTIDFMFPHPAPISKAERIAISQKPMMWGKALKDEMRHIFREVSEVEFEVTSDPLPIPNSRVTIDPKIRDKWGIPVARMELKQHHLDVENNKEVVNHGVEVLEAMGGKRARIDAQGSFIEYVMAGTCRFGSDESQAALNRDCRSFSVPNLFVSDGSFMPTMGGSPNTFTIEANGFRVGDRIIALGKSFGLDRAKHSNK